MRKILIVEDNIDLARKLEYTLQWKELDAVVVNSGSLALSYIRECVSDLIILDADLQDFDGFELCRRLRKLHQRPFPILMICTRQALADRVAGLDAGADDYLVKPFDLAELLARVRAALRRINEIMGSNGHLEIDDLVMDTAGREAWRAGIPIELSKREYDLLELLARNAGKVLTKSCIFENVWGYDTDGCVAKTFQLIKIKRILQSLQVKQVEDVLILHLRFTYVADVFIIMMILKFLQHNLRGVWAPKDTVIDWEKIHPSGFHVLKWRWIVERTFAWLLTWRQLAKDYEVLPTSEEAWIYLAMIRIMIRRLAQNSS